VRFGVDHTGKLFQAGGVTVLEFFPQVPPFEDELSGCQRETGSRSLCSDPVAIQLRMVPVAFDLPAQDLLS
jgi:hypothetical protein